MDNQRLNELLLTVQKPGRYVGGEWNAVKKEWTAERVKFLLAFPEVYEVGMSYLGTKILYGILNGRDDCLAERVFAPWTDFEAVLRNNNLPLFSLESRKPIKEFDIIGFSIAYELTYTNILNILDLGGIPLRSAERLDGDPLIIAGGPSVYNPEPMAEFIDAFVIGDGEEVINEIVDAYKAFMGRGPGTRKKILRELAKIKGVYVPSLYSVEYNPDGTIRSFSPTEPGVPQKIEKRGVKDFDSAFYPVKQIVPNIGIVHDRLAIEVMRGCKHACSFCQATVTYRPCRERSAKRVLELAKEAYAATGYDEISLLSLSSADYSHLREAIESLNAEFCPKSVSLSVPSLRIDDAIKDLPALISKVKKSGLTFAPEAGSERLRKLVNKNIKIEKLFEAVTASFRSGWKKVKLYFMIGLPGEMEQDLFDIVDMAQKISVLKKDLDGRPAEVTASINAFVPKPHTVFQREAMDSMETLKGKAAILRNGVRSRALKLDIHSFEMSYIEAVMSRGGRRVWAAIYEAWKAGARFDGWSEKFSFENWMNSMSKAGVDPAFYTTRPIPADETLPWSIVGLDISPEMPGNPLPLAKD